MNYSKCTKIQNKNTDSCSTYEEENHNPSSTFFQLESKIPTETLQKFKECLNMDEEPDVDKVLFSIWKEEKRLSTFNDLNDSDSEIIQADSVSSEVNGIVPIVKKSSNNEETENEIIHRIN